MLYIITFYAGLIFGIVIISFCQANKDDCDSINNEYDRRKK